MAINKWVCCRALISTKMGTISAAYFGLSMPSVYLLLWLGLGSAKERLANGPGMTPGKQQHIWHFAVSTECLSHKAEMYMRSAESSFD